MLSDLIGNTVLSNFAHLPQPQRLASAFDHLVTVEAVMAEFARRAAQMAGVSVSGTLGVLANLVRGQTLSVAEVDQCLTIIKQHGYRAPVTCLAELIDN